MSKVKRFFLEVETNKLKFVKINIPSNFKIIKEEKRDHNINKFFYKQIGVDHYWRDRLVWSDNDWKKYLSNKNLETWIIKTNNQLVGFYEKEFHEKENEVEDKINTQEANDTINELTIESVEDVDAGPSLENISMENSGLSKREWNELMEAFDLKDKII